MAQRKPYSPPTLDMLSPEQAVRLLQKCSEQNCEARQMLSFARDHQAGSVCDSIAPQRYTHRKSA